MSRDTHVLRRGPRFEYGERWQLRTMQSMPDGVMWLEWVRHHKGANMQFITIELGKRGKASIVTGGRRMSMKKKRRERVQQIADQAIAYVTLMGALEGCPDHEII